MISPAALLAVAEAMHAEARLRGLVPDVHWDQLSSTDRESWRRVAQEGEDEFSEGRHICEVCGDWIDPDEQEANAPV